MDFPGYIIQHKNESESFAIILYKLRKLGIFRNMTSQDYGIDFEIELVEDGRVTGHCVKVQVKSSEKLKMGRDGCPYIGGIKQTTLRYWAELSYSIPVIALCVDLNKEEVYMTDSLFWDIISLLDATNKTKTIKFSKEKNINTIIDEIRVIAKSYSLRDELLAHKWMLRNIRKLFEMYSDSCWYDAYSQNIDVDFFKSFLDNASVILKPIMRKNKTESKVLEQLLSYDFYYKKSNYDEPYNRVIYEGLQKFFLVLLKVLIMYRVRVITSGYFWVYKDDEYLRLVVETEIPEVKKEQELRDFDYDSFCVKTSKAGCFSKHLSAIEELAKCKRNDLQKYLIEKYGHYRL